MNCLITCCGRKLYLIDEFRKALKSILPAEEHKIFVTESDKYSPSLFHADKGFVVPKIIESDYISTILDICLDYNVTFILPTKDLELIKFAQNKDRFSGIVIPLSPLQTLLLCEDKLQFAQELGKLFCVPQTFCPGEEIFPDFQFPVIVKERGIGIETSGFVVCSNKDELKVLFNRFQQPIIQPQIKGIEYTVDCLFGSNSSVIAVIPRQRIKVRQHVSDVGKVINDHEIIALSKKLGSYLKVFGPANIQWIRTPNNILYLIEINPRISGGLQITLSACPQFIKALLQISLNIEISHVKFDHPVVAMKYDSVIYKKLEHDENEGHFF
jgi:carbamoyl-phosphate synthase large subunit